MKIASILLFILTLQSTFAVQFKNRLLSESELKRNSSQYILVDENKLDELFKKKTKKDQSSILHQKAHFHLQKQGLQLNLHLTLNLKDDKLYVLPKTWVIISSSLALYQDNSGFYIQPNEAKKIKIKAFLPIFEKSNHWQFSLNWISSIAGEAKFTKDKSFLTAYVNYFTSSLVRTFPMKDQYTPFSNINKITISASLPVNTQIKTDVKPPKVIVKKSRKALVFAESKHKFNVSRKYLHYTFDSEVKISRNPIKELKIHIPKNFKLNNLKIKPHTGYTLENDRIKFHTSQRDKISVIINGSYPLKLDKTMGHLEAEGIHFKKLEEERGYLSFFTKDVVKIHEVQFQFPETINKIDASELPKSLTQYLKVPILYAFRFFEAKLQFQIKTETFAKYPLKETLISSFLGNTKINPDLSASHKWSFDIQKQDSGNFVIPLPKNINLKSAHLNGKEIHTYVNQQGEFSVDVPSSSLFRSEVGNYLNLNQQSKSLATLKQHKLEVQFLTKNKDKQNFRLEIPLEQDTTNIHYEITNDSIKSPILKTNFPTIPKADKSDLSQFLSFAGTYTPYILPFLIILAAFIYLLESQLGYNLFFHDCFLTKLKLFLSTLLLVAFTIFAAFYSGHLQQDIPSSNVPAHPILQGDFSPSLNHKKIYSVASETNFSHLFSPHGLETPFFIELDFDSTPFIQSPVFTAIFMIVLGLIFFFFYKKSYIKAILFLCLAILLTSFFQNSGSLPPSSSLLIGPLFLLFYPLVKKLLGFKNVAAATFILASCFSPNFAQVIDVYKYKSNKKTLSFIKQSQYPKTVNEVKHPTQTQFYRSDLKFYLKGNSLKLQVDYYLKRDQSNQPLITIPRYQNFYNNKNSFLVEKVSINGQALDIQNIDQQNIQVLNTNQYYPIIQVDYFVCNDFPYDFSLYLQTPYIAIQKLEFPKLKGYSLSSKSSVYSSETKKLYQYHLAAGTQVTFKFAKVKKEAAIVKAHKITKTQVLEPEKLQFTLNHKALIEENYIQIKTQAKILKKGAYQDEFLIHLPKQIKIVNLEGKPKVSDWYVDDKKHILMIKYDQGQKNNLYVDLEMEVPLKSKATDLQSFFNPKADQFENIYHFSANENLSFSILPSNELIASLKNATQLQSEANPSFHQLLHKDTTPKAQSFKIQAIPRQIVHSISAFVDSLRVHSYLQKDGWLFSRYAFTIRNNGQQFFNLKLSDTEQLITARINGDIVQAGKQKDMVVVPMRMELNNKKEIEAFLLEITSKQKVLSDNQGQIRVPNFSLASAQIFYELSLHEPLKLDLEKGAFVRGNFKKEPEFLKNPQATNIKNPTKAPVDFSVYKSFYPIRLHRYFQKANEESPSQGFTLSKIHDNKQIIYSLFFFVLFYLLMIFQSPPKALRFRVILFHILLLITFEHTLSFSALHTIKVATLFSVFWILALSISKSFYANQKKEN
ncbi:MAG: hypothetical protein KC646_12905 [Candidatus Cloacimonetes bacterium]|nr:hypothetical protein [Candidatus Cloacimonadota bacterium]